MRRLGAVILVVLLMGLAAAALGVHDTGLYAYLKSRGVTDLDVCGLATDYFIKATALDARDLGFRVWLIDDVCRGINLRSSDVAEVLALLHAKGVHVVRGTP